MLKVFGFNFIYFTLSFCFIRTDLRICVQVEYVEMGKQQEDAYKEAIEEYREASRARMAKSSENHTNSIFGVLPRRQISNYFVQFRKVLFSFCNIFIIQFCLNIITYVLCLSLILLFFVFPLSFPFFLDCESPFIGEAYLQ